MAKSIMAKRSRPEERSTSVRENREGVGCWPRRLLCGSLFLTQIVDRM